MVEIEDARALRAHVEARGSLDGVVIHGIVIAEVAELVRGLACGGAVFLGCSFDHPTLHHVITSGGIVFPVLGELPYRPYRRHLYTVDELLEGWRPDDAGSFARDSRDARIYAHYHASQVAAVGGVPVLDALAQRLHDHAIDDALQELLHNGGDPLRVVAIMGGHAMRRGEPGYRKVARIAWGLTRAGYFLCSGGGPGAMEATNLGAWMAGRTAQDLESAIDLLAPAPDYHDPAWLLTAGSVRDRFAQGEKSLGVPTWFYGHEPTNLFATHVAKYFSNSLREDGLLAIAKHGVVYAPGSAGTVQEIFMDAAQNHYVTFQVVSPMVLLGTRYWTRERPALPLLRSLAAGRLYSGMITVADEVDAVIDFIQSHPPRPPDDRAE